MKDLIVLVDDRKKALLVDIQGRIKEFEDKLPELMDNYSKEKVNATIQVLKCLKLFGDEIYKYFSSKDDNVYTPEYSKPYILSTILDQIGHDLEVLSRVARDQFSTLGKDTLRKADFLADEALKLAMSQDWFIEPPVVLSYFQKSINVRIIPYANVLMLGIPYTAQNVPWDFLAIPHEIGHHVFWQGLDKGISISKNLFNNSKLKTSDWLSRWTEELFADVYGGFVGGPFIGLSFQDLQLQKLPETFVEDDQDHPVANIRPIIYAKTVNWAKMNKTALLLYNLWEERVEQFKKSREPIIKPGRQPRFFDRFYYGNGKSKRVKTTTTGGKKEEGAIQSGLDLGPEIVDAAIGEIFKLFADPQTNNSDIWKNIIPDLENEVESQNVDTVETFLKDAFDAFIRSPDSLGQTVGEVNLCSQEDYENLISFWENQSSNPKKPWLNVWNAGGWTTEGPDCDSGGTSC